MNTQTTTQAARKFMRHRVIAAFAPLSLITVSTAGLIPAPVSAGLPVFDPLNYAQNLLQAARALQQINQQIQQLQNEAQMITRMDLNLKPLNLNVLPELNTTLTKINTLMAQAQKINFSVNGLDAQFKALFPGQATVPTTTAQAVTNAQTRMTAAMDGFKQAMTVQAQVVENVQSDAQTLAKLIDQSQNASGSLQAAQATNQILALVAKQQFQLQSLMAAQYHSQNLDAARQAQATSDAQAATKAFLGTGHAYTPQ